MIEVVDASPPVDVQTAEYVRLLGYPRGRLLEGRAADLADWAREWYARHGRPWVYARQTDRLALDDGLVVIDGVALHSARVHEALRRARAECVVLAAVSAGPELEEEAQRLWRDERPDEYFFLEIFGSAVVEHLITTTGARLCGWADEQGTAVLPHYSPGYPEWDISEQRLLLDLLRGHSGGRLPNDLEVLESGALRPKKSLLAVFGVTRHVNEVRSLRELVPCENCSFEPCEYRRVPYARARQRARIPASAAAGFTEDDLQAAAPPDSSSSPAPKYAVNERALKRWSEERLTLAFREDGRIDARFRYDGTTCTNMGRPLAFDYAVTLGPREAGYPIQEQRCAPAPGDLGYKYMCEYLREGDRLIEAVAAEMPLIGQPLDAVLAWPRPTTGAACYCEAENRAHKWGLVLETIHYALSRREGRT